MSRLQNYLIKENIELIPVLIEFGNLNESNTEMFNNIKKAANKLGLKINKSLSIWDFLDDAGNLTIDLFNLASLYLLTDIKDIESRKEIVKEAKKLIKNLDKKELMSFLFQLDKTSFGITAHIRHIFQSVFGIEITTYNNWIEDKKYLYREIDIMIAVLNRMGNYPKEIKYLKKFKKQINNL